MKEVLETAGGHPHTRDTAGRRPCAECREAAERIGYPLIVKPIDGAGSADTYRIDSSAELERIFPALRHVPQVSVEEFIDGDDMTFDTVCVGGEIAHFNICRYRPRALESKQHEWMSPQTFALRDLDAPELASGRAMGFAGARGARVRDRIYPHGVVRHRLRVRRCSVRSPPGRRVFAPWT